MHRTLALLLVLPTLAACSTFDSSEPGGDPSPGGSSGQSGSAGGPGGGGGQAGQGAGGLPGSSGQPGAAGSPAGGSSAQAGGASGQAGSGAAGGLQSGGSGQPGGQAGGQPGGGQAGSEAAGSGQAGSGQAGSGAAGSGAAGSGPGGDEFGPLTGEPPACDYEGPLTVDDSFPLEDGVIVLKDRCFRRDTTEPKPGSSNQTEPVIQIATTRPVRIDHCVLVGAGNLIDATGGSAHLTVHRTRGYALTPTIDDVMRGRFILASDFLHIEVTRSYLSHTSGLQIWSKQGDGSDGNTVRFVGNIIREADGRFRNEDAYGKPDVVGNNHANIIGFNVIRARGIEIAWNHAVSTPGQSRVEDNLGLYRAAGFEDSPLRVHHNFIRGGWPYPVSSGDWTGSGVTTDGDAAHATDSEWVLADHNVFVGVPFNIAIGRHHRFVDNTYLTSGKMPDGQPINKCYWCVGGVFNFYESQTCGQSFADNRIVNLTIGLDQQEHLPVDCPQNGNAIEGTTKLPGPITLATEDAAEADFFAQAAAAGVAVGP